MKLIKVEYLEESSEAIFFDVIFEKKSFFTIPKIYNKRCFMEKSRVPKYPYSNYFKFCDNTGFPNFYEAVVQEMILQYEKQSKYEKTGEN